MKKMRVLVALVCAVLLLPNAVSALAKPVETAPRASSQIQQNGHAVIVEYAPELSLQSAEVQDALQKMENYDIKTLTVLPGGGVAVTFNIPEDVAPAQAWNEKMVELNQFLETLQGMKPPVGPEAFFKRIYPDQGSSVPFSTWKNGYYYAGRLQKMEFSYAKDGIAYYEYKGWIKGYDPEQIAPDAVVTEISE